MQESSAVLPVPRGPMSMVERLGLPRPSSNARDISASMRSRPARNGGTIPKVGVKGLREAMHPPLLSFSTFFASFDPRFELGFSDYTARCPETSQAMRSALGDAIELIGAMDLAASLPLPALRSRCSPPLLPARWESVEVVAEFNMMSAGRA